MGKITRLERAATAAIRYVAHNNSWGIQDKSPDDNEYRMIWEKLKALGDRPSPEAVNEVVGNNSWTTVFCESHMEFVDEAIKLSSLDPFTEEEYKKFIICKDCLQKALSLLD
jgi:hypothetical protein